MSVPSTHRPVALKARADLRFQQVDFQGARWWVVKDPIALKYHRLRDDQYRILRLLDGVRSLEELREALQAELPTAHCTHEMLQRAVTDMHQKELLQSGRLGQGPVLRHAARREWWGKFRQAAMNPLSITLPGWDAQKLLDRLLGVVGWIFHPAAMIAVALMVAAAVGWLALHRAVVESKLPEFSQFFSGHNLALMWLTLGGAKILHEFGHGLACRRFGAECHHLGVMLLVFSPCLYCDASDSWMLPSKWRRILIGFAGIHFELILSSVAVVVWWNTSDGLINHLCLNLIFVSSLSTIVFNLNPLMRLDGYFMLSDYLEIPNLRETADRMLRERFASICLGIESPPDPLAPERNREAFVVYSIACWLYRWVVVFGITYFLCTALKPYGLQSVGMTAAAVSIGGMAVSLGVTIWRVVTAPREDPMNRKRVAWSLGAAGLLLAVVVLAPLPFFCQAPFTVEPRDVRHVYAAVPGSLTELRVRPGDRVRRGDVLVVLDSPDLRKRRRELEVSIGTETWNQKTAFAVGDSSQHELSESHLTNLQSELAEVLEQLEQLTVVAPIDGTIVAAERVAEPTLDVERSRLGRWFGTPIDPANLGCLIEASTHLLSVAPSAEFDAVLYVDQSDRDNLGMGQSVSLKLDEFPNETLSGRIASIAVQEERQAAPGLAMKHGGSLATTPDPTGRERLSDPAYRAVVPIPAADLGFAPDAAPLRAGLRGRARIAVPRSLGAWLWRALLQLVHFRL